VTKVIELRVPECAITGENIHAQGFTYIRDCSVLHTSGMASNQTLGALGRAHRCRLSNRNRAIPRHLSFAIRGYEALHAAEQEYAVVFPEYYFGRTFEARREPGTIAYSTHLQLELLFTPASGGTRAFLITIQETVRPQPVSAASLK
jgi:hypothetical protein